MAEEFHLGEGGVETLKSLVAAMIGDAVDAAEKPDECAVVREVEAYLGLLPALYRMGMVWILRALEVAPLALGYRHQFSNLPREDRVQVLKDFEASNNYVQRGIILALKSQIAIVYFSEPTIEAALGYDHACLRPH
jgi:hypothetical protein